MGEIINLLGLWPKGCYSYLKQNKDPQTKDDKMNLKINQNLPLSVKFEDAQGNAASVDGAPAWSVTDASLATLQPSADGLSCLVVPTGPTGSLTVQCAADVDLGSGVTTILGSLDLVLVSAEATQVDISAGTPVDQAPVAP